MIRRDYLLKMIQEFIQALGRIHGLQERGKWKDATVTVEQELIRLTGKGAQALALSSDTEILARIIEGEPTQVVRDKSFMVARLLKEAGDAAARQQQRAESRSCHLKSLHLVLDVFAQSDTLEHPEFVPAVQSLVTSLQDGELPLRIQVLLMRHYERAGDFAQAENVLFSMLDSSVEQAAVLEFGLLFYKRLQAHSDWTLDTGNLPRHEVAAGLKELHQRARRFSVL